MKSWPVTYAMFACQTVLVALAAILLNLGDLAVALLYIATFFVVVAISKRPEFEGLPPPPKESRGD